MSTAPQSVEQVKALVELALTQNKYDTAVGILFDCIVSLHKEIERLDRTKANVEQRSRWD